MNEQRTGCALVLAGGDGDGASNGASNGNGNGNGNGVPGAAAGTLIGIFTERDFLARVVAAGRGTDGPVGDVMTPTPVTVSDHDSIGRAVEVMQAGGYRHLPVIGEGSGRPIGVLSVADVVHYLVEYFPSNVYNLPPTPDQNQPAREGA
jgi:CBS domain-containing protein